MKLIPVGSYSAKIDDEDYELVSKYKWRRSSITKKNTTGRIYAVAHASTTWRGRNDSIRMHRLIMNAPEGVQVDHIDGDSLNNQKSNLRFANNSQNGCNKPPQKGKKLKGVIYRERNGINKYEAYIKHDNKSYYLGSFPTEEEAARKRDEKAKELHGEFAFLNLKS